MFDQRIKRSLKLFGQVGLGLVCAIAFYAPSRAVAAEPPRLISPELFVQTVPPPPPPAPAAEGQPPASVPPPPPEQSELALPEVFDPNDPAMEPVDLHLKPLTEWNNLNEESPTLHIDARYADGKIMGKNFAQEAPKDLTVRSNISQQPRSLDLVDGGGIENPYFAPVSPFCYKPLYFEEGCLERHGQSAGPLFQPLFSGLEFYTRIGLLPVKMIFEKPNREYLTIWPEPVDPAWEYGF